MFNIGDKVFNPENINKIYTVIDVDAVTRYIPTYTLLDEDGVMEWESYCIKWHKVVTDEYALRYGKILTDDEFVEHGIIYRPIRIRTISYDNRIFYHKMVNGEVVEFKELTI